MKQRSYSELMTFKTMDDRYNYLKLSGEVGEPTFGSKRYLNQNFYRSKEWRDIRSEVILRDLSCDLAIPEYEIYERPIIHHINPITMADIADENWDKLTDLENLITVSYNTHQAIHYGNSRMIPGSFTERKPGDTCLWSRADRHY